MNREEELFAEALALPLNARAAFLDRACGADFQLRARLMVLLDAHAASANFLARSALAAGELGPEEKPGDRLGRYKLVKKIGEGGCGVVYLADQEFPVRRRVALKVIKLGMDTRQVIARFEAERQALAMMDHPDIARVYDAGTTAAGRPYFVMEYVDGVPITKFCDEAQLSLRERLELFARVCVALQHAHQKGVIHRDIKPSNILVTVLDGVPSPRVIDFGIAKATQGPLADSTLFTGFDQFIGTPAYMSPEQAELRDQDIDTRSDVYSLGVLLYELLAGRPPFDPKSLIRAGVEEIRRIIREVDPPRPSTVVSTLGEADRSTFAARWRAAPRRLTSVLRGDLDWIVMRCLEKNRDRRYDSAHELADDVRRHLRSEPVSARPPQALYRLRKFIARHRVACASAAAITGSLLTGAIVSVRQAIRATRAEAVAKAERADAQLQQQRAEALLTFMLGDFRTELAKFGKLTLLDAVGDQALAHFSALEPRLLTDTALASHAKALSQIGSIRMDEGRFTDAEAAFTQAYARAAALVVRHPRNSDVLYERGQAEFWIGFVARKRGDSATAGQWLTRYRDTALALAGIEGKVPRALREVTLSHNNLAVLEFDQGNYTAARAGFLAGRVATVALASAEPAEAAPQTSLVNADVWLGRVAEKEGDFAQALRSFAEASSRAEQIARLRVDDVPCRFKYIECLTFVGAMESVLGRRAEALATYAKAEGLISPLVASDPKNRQWLLGLLVIRLQMAALGLATEQTAAVIPSVRNIRHQLEGLLQAEPSSVMFARMLATAWRLEAALLGPSSLADAESTLARGLELGETLVREGRANEAVLGEFAQACLLAGRLADSRGQSDIAHRHWNRVVEILRSRLANSTDWKILDPAAQALVLLGNAAEAAPLVERLRRFGYFSTDPLAASILGTSVQLDSSTKKNNPE